MFDHSKLYGSHAPANVGSILSTSFEIFAGHWRPLVKLALVQMISMFSTIIVLGFISFIIAATYIFALMAVVQKQMSSDTGNWGRHLFDYSVNMSGASRLLDQTSWSLNGYYEGNDDDFDMADIFSAKLVLTIVGMYISWIIILSAVASIFVGAFIHTLAEIYSGGTPIVSKSIRHGISKVGSVMLCQFIILFTITVIALVTTGLPIYFGIFEHLDSPHVGIVILGVLVFIFTLAILNSLLAAVVPAIVVERKSAVEALKRSWYLCKGFLGMIFCSQFCYNAMLMTTAIVVDMALSALPDSLGFINAIGHLCVSVTVYALGPILCFVLYMSIRVQTENITQEDLAHEIDSGDMPYANAVEMQTNKTNDSKGEYTNVTAQLV